MGPGRSRSSDCRRPTELENALTRDAEPRIASAPPKAVDVAAIERELAHLWDEPAASDTPPQVTRACMSNLVVFGGDAVDEVVAEIPEIVHQHPARVLVLGAAPAEQTEDIEAFVSAQCYLGSEGRQVCSEHVMIRAQPVAVGRVPSIVRPLLIGDVPTALWSAEDYGTVTDTMVDQLIRVAKQIIYDSAGWGDSLAALEPAFDRAVTRLDHLAGADLTWQRLQRWMRFISDVLDPHVAPDALDTITGVSIEHGPRGLSPALLLASWLASRLGWKPATATTASEKEAAWSLSASQATVSVSARAVGGEAGLHTVAIRSHASTWRFVAPGPGRLEAISDGDTGPKQRRSFPVRDRAALVALQLSDLGRSSVFREVVRTARDLARTTARTGH